MIFSIDTSTKYFSVSVADINGNLIYEILVNSDGKHSEVLFDNIKLLFEKTNLSFKNLTKIATTTGPGSFTGIRIGLAFAQTVAQLCQIPIVGISTLDLLAYQVLFNEENLPEKFFICSMIPAIQNEVYTGVYIAEKRKNKIRRLSDFAVIDMNNIIKIPTCHPFVNLGIEIASLSRKDILGQPRKSLKTWFVGDGALKHLTKIKKITNAVFAKEKNCIPSAATLSRISASRKGSNLLNIKPIYVKPPRIHLH